MPFFIRYVDGDLLCFVHAGAGVLQTEFGPLPYRTGDWVYLPKATTWRQVPESATTLLMIQATDEFRVPRRAAGPAFPVRSVPGVDPRTGPVRRRADSTGPRRLSGPTDPRGRADHAVLPAPPAGCRRLARRQFRVHLQHRRLQRDHLRLGAPAADGSPVHAGHRRVRDELPPETRRERARHRTHPVVSPQRRLRRDRVLPRRIAQRNPDAARTDQSRPARGPPRCTRSRPRAFPPQVRRVRLHRLAGDRRRRPPTPHPLPEILTNDLGQHA